MDVVSQLDADPDDVEAHLDDMLATGAVIPGAHIALERILQATRKEDMGVCVTAGTVMHCPRGVSGMMGYWWSPMDEF